MQDSGSFPGQLLFDKRANNGLNLAVLHLANHMQTQQDMYGQLMYGDKDTFVSHNTDIRFRPLTGSDSLSTLWD